MANDKRYIVRRMYLPDSGEVQGTNFAHPGIHINQDAMGNNRLRLRPGYQFFDDHRLSLFLNSRNTGFSNVHEFNKRMAEINFWKWVITIVGLPSYLGAIWLNIQNNADNWKANILFVLGGVFLIARMVVYVIKARQDIRLREWEFEQKTKENKKEPD
jgi:hypothetical protein